MKNLPEIINPRLQIAEQFIKITKEKGYLFIDDFLDVSLVDSLQNEINSLVLEFGDHVNHPINNSSKNEVKQLHHRFYSKIGKEAPEATKVCDFLSAQFSPFIQDFYYLNEIGYQRYYAPNDWISPHRDRKSDQLLSITITISGSAWIHIYEFADETEDYKNLKKVDSYLTKSGTVMLLRAPGLGNGKQIIHEVMPPLTEKRDILNLRMRPSILKSPEHTKWK